MRWAFTIIFSLAVLVCGHATADTTGRVIKVLPQYADAQGRTTLSPSLYERDAYQAELLRHPDQRGSLLFHVQWKTSDKNASLKLRVEARGIVSGKNVKTLTWETPVQRHGWFSQWTQIPVAAADFKTLGTLTAWRVTLWDGERQLGGQHSFLW